MQLKLEPSTELSIKIGDKRVGKLEALIIDISKSTGLFSFPKVKLSIAIDAKAFNGNEAKLEELKKRAGEYKWLEVLIYK